MTESLLSDNDINILYDIDIQKEVDNYITNSNMYAACLLWGREGENTNENNKLE